MRSDPAPRWLCGRFCLSYLPAQLQCSAQPVACGAGVLLVALFAAAPHADAQGPAGVRVAPVEEATVAAPRTFIGSVHPVRRTVIGSAVAGRVETVHYDEGDFISLVESDPGGEGTEESSSPGAIVQLRTKTIGLELEVAKAELQLRQSELDELLAGSREEEKIQAAAKREALEALAQYADSRHKRTEKLYRQNVTATQQELEETLSQKLAAEQNLAAARAEYELVMKGPREEEIDQARARLKQSEETVERLRDVRSKYTIRSPFSGYLIRKQTEVGAWVNQGDPVAEVIEVDPAEIEIAVPENYVGFLRPRMTVTLKFEAIPEEVFTGEIYRVVPQADLRSRTFPVKVRLDNPYTTPTDETDPATSHLLKAGMLAHAILAVGRKENALLVPKDALILSGATTSVMVVEKDPDSGGSVARSVPVEIGVADGSKIQVIDRTGGLAPGQQVVVVGNERLRPGQAIRIIPN